MFQYVLDRIGTFCRENSHGGIASHPDRQLCHEEMGAVFRQQANASAGLQIQTFQMRSHAARLIQRLRPRVIHNLVVAQGLC